MKKIMLLFLAVYSLAACKKDGPDAVTSNLNVDLSFANTSYREALNNSEVTVRLKNLLNGALVESKHKLGAVQFASIASGAYDIEASISFTKDEFLNLTGEDAGGATITFNASAKNVSITSDTQLQLQLIAGVNGDFVIKQVYYAGSDNRDGASFRDQFFEIYNNTDRVLYADSLYFGRLWGKQSATDASHHFQANGQLDWSKSIDMTIGAAANSDYVYARDLFMIPGSGKDHPVQPGESIVIAQNALNHKVPFIGNNGREVTVRDPSLTIDLSGADFETYFGDLPGETPFASDIDNPNVPNVQVIVYQGNDWLLDALGRDSYYIFKGPTRQDVTALKKYYAPLLRTPSVSAREYTQIPAAWIMDGLDAQPNVASSQIPKKLFPSIDAGYTFVTEGSYSSLSVMRKVAREEGGRKILQDTNNSTNDFVSGRANPRGFAN
ncbi:DUF4876 domain-containing protein [Sphingobacterium paludis]|jgi:hypothetical protein|uniref:Uncharacterized protein DUF4876 n=1 Tax=Sphingobacterium paludis TaxID=1476465 RepID=A0A4R7DAY6_9SPHI|nr:DUF4876 domain-containing protein [Sphingobacterium paludis]TDS17602.1 uncharacterized protein DUF4876 [Sphingobacterium paludis]